jgi:hypothetical protein
MRVKLCARCPIRRAIWQATAIPRPPFMYAQSATANKGFPLGITRARPRGDENV